ncbi:MAG: hypothetical protein AAGJ46_14190 [Planctomycetota bacterium]
MSFALIQAALATLFVVVWVYIGATVLADRMAESRRRRLIDGAMPEGGSSLGGPHRRRANSRTPKMVGERAG